MSKEKIRLKEMSHKKLRKLCKGLGKECAEYSKQVGFYKSAEIRNAGTIGELKSYVRSLEKTLASEARRVQEKNEKLEEKNKRIEEIETAYATSIEALHGEARENLENKKKIEELEKQLEAFGNRSMPIGKLTPFIGELPEDVSMGIDGQLMTEEEEAARHAAWVAREVARVQQENFDNGQKEFNTLFGLIEEEQEEQVEGDCIGHTKAEQIVTPVSQEQINKKMDEAVEWAKRNGHHQPEGNPEPNKMDTVRIKSADEISAENIDKHTEMVCNDIAKDKSRFL